MRALPSLRRFDALAAGSPLVLAVDFDGTLAPIVDKPSQARMPASLRRRLTVLGGMEGVLLAVISGRSLTDLRRRCRLPGAVLIGNHGLSSTLKGIGLSVRQAVVWRAVLREAKRRMEPLRFKGYGALLEDKGLGISIHLRGMRPAAKAVLTLGLARALSGLDLELRSGLEVLELRPKGSWDKGRALRKLTSLLAKGWSRKGACFFAGDDATDEDAFKALKGMGPRALGIKVGSGPSAAGMRVASPEEFWLLLERIHKRRSA